LLFWLRRNLTRESYNPVIEYLLILLFVEMETKKILLEAYKERQQKAVAAGAIPSFYRKVFRPSS